MFIKTYHKQETTQAPLPITDTNRETVRFKLTAYNKVEA